MRWMFILPLLLLAACATTGTTPFQELKDFTVKDAQAALADATARNDVLASTCYTALIDIGQNNVPTLPPEPIGALTTFQAARDIQQDVSEFGKSALRQK